MNEKELDKKKEHIQELGLNAIEDFFKIDIASIDPKLIGILHQKARIAMSFERELATSKRAVELNYIRVFREMAEDKAEFKRYVKKSLPQYSPL